MPLVYLRPGSLPEAIAALTARPFAIIAGGTDFYPARVGRPVAEDVLDITRVTELRGVREEADAWHVGALATWTELINTALPAYFAGLKLAAREIGGVQIQNTGTLAGNVCNASPAADGVPALLALDAQIELAGAHGVRRLPVAAFLVANRKTARKPDELVTGIRVPKWPAGTRADFFKLGSRKYLVISIAMVSTVIAVDANGVITRCGVAVGACSAVAQRLSALEAKLVGKRLAPDLADLVVPADLQPLSPIADVRGTPEYRLDVVQTLLKRALARIAA
ncbi:MAG: xanthine dehydrogenase family protein subunit M [Betaproteobacteria bacterium]|nr:xanthine dehydrogenase family protein subunit M [Betaproteobacteria bacterium]